MINSGDAIAFHSKLCSRCHKIPGADEWITSNTTTDGIKNFSVLKSRVRCYK